VIVTDGRNSWVMFVTVLTTSTTAAVTDGLLCSNTVIECHKMYRDLHRDTLKTQD